MDDQTRHDLALDAVFDQLNYTQSSLGAKLSITKMRLLEFQPQDQLHDLEAFFEEHPDLRLKVQVISTNWVRRITTWRVALSQIPASIMQVCPLYSLGLSSNPLSLAIPFEPVEAITLLVISVVFDIVFSSLQLV